MSAELSPSSEMLLNPSSPPVPQSDALVVLLICSHTKTRRKGELRVGVCHKVSANWDDHFWAERKARNGDVASIQAQRIVGKDRRRVL